MVRYIVKRLLLMVPTLVAISIVSFTIINLPPGDFVDRIVAQRLTAGEAVTAQEAADLRAFYGLDRSVGEQYVVWVSNIFVRGDFGRSFRWDLPVRDLVWERMALTLLLSVSSLLFIWVVAIPIGIFSAVRRYSLGDYIATFLGFVGVSIPNFLSARVLGGFFLPSTSTRPGVWPKFWICSAICGFR
jgi:peptide/nickel transport system permease protein